MNEILIALIGYYSAMYSVDPLISLSVAKVESNFNQQAIGSKNEIGVFQIMPHLFPNKNLRNLRVNIQTGIKHLAWNKRYCKHKVDNTWLVCYNYGVGNAQKVKHPKLWPYYKKVMKIYKEYESSKLRFN